MIVLYENLGSTTEALSVDIPAATSVDLGVVRRGSVPAPGAGALMVIGLASVALRRRGRG